MFKRTSLGIANEHLFYNVEYIVYCEGDVADESSLSLDEAFWTKVLEQSDKKFIIKGLGSKTGAQSIIQDINEGSAKNTIVVLDADYDFYLNTTIDHPQILYTQGYSWESDVISEINFERVLSLFCNTRDVAGAKASFNAFIAKNQKLFWRACLLDLRYIRSTYSLFDRRKPLSIVTSGPDGYPVLNRSLITAQALKLKGTGVAPNSYPFNGPSNGMRYFFGKTASLFIYKWFVAFSSRIRGKRSIPYDAFMSSLVTDMDFSSHENCRNAHYKHVLSLL